MSNNVIDMQKDTKIKIENISLQFGGVPALTEISTEIRDNEILAIIGPALLNPTDLGQGVWAVGRFKWTGEQMLFLHWLRRHFRIYAGRPEKQQPLHTT